MISRNKKCKEEHCSTIPCFNLQNEKFGIYCDKHKTDNMVNVNKKCKEEHCNTIPCFNLQNEKLGIYCSKHKKENIPSRASSSLRSHVLVTNCY